MMLPAHVGGLEDALFYLREWVEWLGAVDRSLEQPVMGLLHRDRLARVVLLPTEFRFVGGRRLAARATIGSRLRPATVATLGGQRRRHGRGAVVSVVVGLASCPGRVRGGASRGRKGEDRHLR